MALQPVLYSSLSALFLGLSAVLILLGSGLEPTDLDCVKNRSSWSPAWEALHHEWRTFQNGFMQESPYKGEPSLTLEAVWNSSLPEDPIVFSHEELALLGDETSNFVVNENHGAGLGHLEVFRNLACLNFLRQTTYITDYDYSYLEAFKGPESSIHEQVDGCVQRLRQVLMCEGDATPYLIVLTPERKQKESPDFNTLHYCRDFNSVLSWTREHGSRSSARLPGLHLFTG
ncbi:hypothetical protein F5B17DRAFT_413220 [Nemania serpens]|nr:hypothetical protein F5B17DRAFT_413220 [Nemania serpens]